MRSLLCILFLVGSALAVLTPEQLAKIEPISKECRTISKVTDEQITRIRNGESVGDPEIKKHLLCGSQKTGLISDSGDLNWDTIESKLQKAATSDEKIAEIEKCAVKKEKPEDTAFTLMSCISTHQPNFSPAD
ncbi:hypothetical protein Zmor_013050 [Zophobas morio]|uniref:Uncharacterized protein n=1 Tax=Zophobas morio TaxID=2755281 RepID=A0AA38IH29_9CUCU|nr:hypothetical protein Zmor_013050 [Zophobas morio]